MNLHRPRLACFSLFLNLELFCRNSKKKKQLLNSALGGCYLPRPHPPRSEEFFISFSASFSTVEPRHNKPLNSEVLGITNDFLHLSNSKYMKKNLDITKHCYSEQILPVPRPFVISRFHCNN